MSDPRNNEVRAAEGGPSAGDSHEAPASGLQTERNGSRDLLRREKPIFECRGRPLVLRILEAIARA